MRKLLLFTMLCFLGLSSNLNAQNEIESSFDSDFNDYSFNDIWAQIDQDQDGHYWELHNTTVAGGVDSTYGAYSSCFFNGDTLKPDNYLITLKKYMITEHSVLSFMHTQSSYADFKENISVVISESDVSKPEGREFIEVWTKRYTEPYPEGEWGSEEIDLSKYAGKAVHIGFRHHGCTGKDAAGIRIDNVSLSDGALEAPTGLKALVEQDLPDYPQYKYKVTLSWMPVEGADCYDVYVNTETAQDFLMGYTPGNIYIVGTNKETEFEFYVVAVSSTDSITSAPSEKYKIIVKDDAIEEVYTSLNVYPNPVEDFINIETETEIEEVAIYNVQGQQTTDYRLQTSSTGLGQQTMSVDMSDLESGVYFIEVKTKEGNSVRRVIKN